MLRTLIAALVLFVPRGMMSTEGTGPPTLGQDFKLPRPAVAMLWVAPGTFYMSGTISQGDDTAVTLTQGYWLGRTEITQAQWQTIMGHYPNPSFFKGSDRPVERVSWEVINLFLDRLNQQERERSGLPAGYTYALPTEAQWEFAGRAGTEGNYPGDLDAMAWYDANSDGETHPVAQKLPNAWGFYDMSGNVREWCADWYGGYPGGHADDPGGPRTGLFRVIRGGSSMSTAGANRIAWREFWRPSLDNLTLGFRLALVPSRPTATNK